MKKGLVISGGGAYGAYGVGTLAALNNEYDLVCGVSTGSLMSMLVALNKFDVLKTAYTNVTQDSIFDSKWYRPNTFKKNGKVNELAILYVLLGRIFGYSRSLVSLGTTNNMRKLIDKFVSFEDYNMLATQNKEVVVAAVNLKETPSQVHHFSTKKCSFQDFKDWMWSSANAPLFTSLIQKTYFDEVTQKSYLGEWTDGGLSELFSYQYALDAGCTEIDVILHRTKPVINKETGKTQDIMDNLERCIDAMRYDIEFSNGRLDTIFKQAAANGVKINVYWLGRKLADNSLIFDKTQMTSWYDEGFATAFDDNRIDRYGV